jgi:adenylate cyclase
MQEPIDFAALGLLDGLSGGARAERKRLLSRLLAGGISPEELINAHANDALLFVGAERLIGGGGLHTLREVALTSGIELALLERLMHAVGLAVPGVDERVYGDGDLELAQVLAAYRAAGVDDETLLDVARVLARALAPVAEVMGQIAISLTRDPQAREEELAQRWLQVVSNLTPMLDQLLGRTLSLHLRNYFRSEAVSTAELSAQELPGARPIAVAFADLVGFTRAGERLGAHEISAIALRLERLGVELAQPPVRLVKTLGDGLMLVSPELPALLHAALGLVNHAESEQGLPPLRAGIAYGNALSRAADWYGRPVNLASRLTDIARPGAVLTDEEIRSRLRDQPFSWSYAGTRRLKGISEPIRLYRVRALAADTPR